MKKLYIPAILACFFLLTSHDLIMKPYSYLLEQGDQIRIALFNGDFHKSDNVITRDRMVDVSFVSEGKRMAVDTANWTDEGTTSILTLPTTATLGTKLLGVSTAPRVYTADGTGFNKYLKHDGVLDMLELRTRSNSLQDSAFESYSKHVKTIIQVGENRSNDWKEVLDYPIEFVPLSNPYDLQVGDDIELKLLRDGKPLTGHLVYAANHHYHGDDAASGHSHSHEEGEEHTHDDAAFTTDENGVIKVPLTEAGIWYFRTIHMTLVDEPGLTHESNWATLTFELAHSHSSKWMGYALGILGGLAIMIALYALLKKKEE